MWDWTGFARRRMGELQLTQEQVAERIGYTQGAFGHWLNGRRQPTLEQFDQIAAALEVRPSMLVYGVQGGGAEGDVAAVTAASEERPNPGYLRLPLLDVRASAGPGYENGDYPEVLRHLDILESHIRHALRVVPENLRLLTVRGDSMAGTLQHNDVLFVDVSERRFEQGGVYVLLWNGRLLVKRLVPLMDGRLEVRSDNPAYPPEYLDAMTADQLRVVGRVAGAWSLKLL